jgi:hypothetical protein
MPSLPCHSADLARDEVERAAVTVKAAILKSFAKDKKDTELTAPPSYPIILDAPRYLFVSTNVSQRFPHLLESVIIQSYHTCSPPDHSTPWSRAHSSLSSSSSFWWTRGSKSRAAKSFLTSLMQQFGSTSPALQRFLIHLMQPLLVSSLVFLWAFLFNHPEWFSLLGLVLVVGLSVLIVRQRRQQQDANEAAWIHPLSEQVKKTGEGDNNPAVVDAHVSVNESEEDDPVSDDDHDEDEKDSEDEMVAESPGEDSSGNFLILSEEEEQRERSRFDSLDSLMDDSLGDHGISLDFSVSDSSRSESRSSLDKFDTLSRASDQSSYLLRAVAGSEATSSSSPSMLSADGDDDGAEDESRGSL